MRHLLLSFQSLRKIYCSVLDLSTMYFHMATVCARVMSLGTSFSSVGMLKLYVSRCASRVSNKLLSSKRVHVPPIMYYGLWY